MFHLEFDSELVCSLLEKSSNLDLSYSDQAFSGRFKLPLGGVSANIFPEVEDQVLIFNIPFASIKADFGGQFLVSKIVKAFWGMISKKVESACHPWLRRQGLPENTIKASKATLGGQEFGQIAVSMSALNRWLESRQPNLLPNLTELIFLESGIRVAGTLRGL